MSYRPPYTITPSIISLVAEISEKLGRLSAIEDQASSVRLRRINRIRIIQGSLAIEGNTLSEEQITAVLEGTPVIAPPSEVQEARNAILAYDSLSRWRAASQKDLLTAHQTLMQGMIDDAGQYRRSGVGVMQGRDVIHMAPPADRVEGLMIDLLGWLRKSEEHPLISSSVFHYEFEFIHPFSDGNGRMGRLWQTLILSRWKAIFAYLPVESMVHSHQADYYKALEQSTLHTDCAPFIEFVLSMIFKACHDLTPQVTPQATPQVTLLISHIKGEMTREELMRALSLKDAKNFRQHYLLPALSEGLIEMTQPDRPQSPTQKYRLTRPH